MKDLTFTHLKENCEEAEEKYDTIMDFMEAYEKSKNGESTFVAINAVFFENPLNTKKFDTAKELYEHCKCIVS